MVVHWRFVAVSGVESYTVKGLCHAGEQVAFLVAERGSGPRDDQGSGGRVVKLDDGGVQFPDRFDPEDPGVRPGTYQPDRRVRRLGAPSR